MSKSSSLASGAGAGPITPGATVGIIGGGQLGRMIAVAAAQYGLKAHIYCPDPDSPAFEVAGRRTIAPYDDEAALQAFAESVDVVTYEFENIPSRTAEILAARRPLHPSASALATTQDRLTEKSFVAGLGIPVAPFRAVDDASGLAEAVREIGLPAVLKTRRFGYDGKGQVMLREAGFDPAAVMASLGNQPCILEGFVAFEAEVSVVAARTAEGGFSAYEPCANEHRHHILARTVVPAPGMAEEAAAEAMAIARTIAEALGYVGVLAVEMFLVRGSDGRASVVVNEIAPRVHNSGHWTIEGAQTSQFAQHVRAICGWPLGGAGLTGPSVEMLNLIGDQADDWTRILAEPGSHLHLYGKGEARPGRKMGHLTRVAPHP